jgi:hypothetical protein
MDMIADNAFGLEWEFEVVESSEQAGCWPRSRAPTDRG